MRILVAAVTAFVMLAAASASAQSLEKTYADLCADPAKAKSESCVVLAQALVAKLQGQGAAATGATAGNPTGPDTPAGSDSAAPASAGLEVIWGIYGRLIGSTLTTGKNGPPTSWRWGEGDEIIETQGGVEFRKIRRGAAIGELLMLEGRDFDQVRKGTVGTDGAVTFSPAKDRGGLLAEPSRRTRLEGEVVIVEELKVKDGRVVDAWESFRYFGKIADAGQAGTMPDAKPVPMEATMATPPAARGTGTKQDPIPLALGQKVVGRLDDNSPRSAIMRSRSAYYRLAGRKGQTVVVALDCDVNAFYACFYTAAVPEKTLGYELELADSPVLHAWRVTLKADNPLLHVYSNGTVEYAVVVQDGAAGDALWAEAKSARARYDAAVAQGKRERSANRAALFGAVMQGLAQGAAEVGTGGYAEAQANLDATVANINAAAAAERQHQALVQQQAQARAAEEQRAQLAENARWVAEKEQAAAEYRSGQVEAAAAREAQLQEQQRATEQRRAAAEVERRNAEQAEAASRQSAAPSNLTPGATVNLGTRDSALADCPYVPRVVNGISGIHESKGDAEAKARAGAHCGYGGVESMGTVSCTSHMKVDVTMSNGKTSTTESPRWVCNVDATCAVGTPVCTDKPKGSSAQ